MHTVVAASSQLKPVPAAALSLPCAVPSPAACETPWRSAPNAGRISHVDIAVDDVVVERIDIDRCRQQVLVERGIDVGALDEGVHRVTVTAYQGSRRAGLARSASTAFLLDRTLPVGERNRVEELATPTTFACLSLKGGGKQDDDEVSHAASIEPCAR